MAILVGYHVEGWDHLIFHALLARLLDLEEQGLAVDWIDAPGRGWSFVLEQLPTALRRFYARCAQMAIVGVDNDGNLDLVRTGRPEDPSHPRHWNHAATLPQCRFCQLVAKVESVRADLNYLPRKPGASWPVLVAVPVEQIEAWLLSLQWIIRGHSVRAEGLPRSTLKQQIYGRQAATRRDVEETALPLVRTATLGHLRTLREACRSFGLFFDQLAASRSLILGPRDCWAPGDGAADQY